MTAAQFDSSQFHTTLLVALELSDQSWKLAFFTDSVRRVRIRNIPARDICRLEREIAMAKQKFQLDESAPVQTCYEAGRDGFWIHRVLLSMEVQNFVIESSSLEVDRRQKQRKTDRLDAEKMVHALARYCRGEQNALRVNHVPDAVDEDLRNLQRELTSIRGECTRFSNRIKSLLVAQGIVLERISRDFPKLLPSLKTGDGNPLGLVLRQRLEREFQRLQLAVEQVREVEIGRAKIIRAGFENPGGSTKQAQIAVRLMELCGIGVEASWTLSTELFAWRNFRNRRQVGAIVGLTPTPYSSGKLNCERGISKSGRGQLRALMVEISWLWLRYQPKSSLTRWFYAKASSQSTRCRRIAIVALARKLLVALWKYIDHGEIPEGVKFKQEAQWKRIRLRPSLS